jgi:hypothetical protein
VLQPATGVTCCPALTGVGAAACQDTVLLQCFSGLLLLLLLLLLPHCWKQPMRCCAQGVALPLPLAPCCSCQARHLWMAHYWHCPQKAS